MMNHWLTSFDPKKHQRALNKMVRKMNKMIEQDDLWCGRFMAHQVESPQWMKYEDNSGAKLWVVLEFVDRCTGRTWKRCNTVNHWCCWDGANLYHEMNVFIVERCRVWEEPLARKKETRDAWREYNKNIRV